MHPIILLQVVSYMICSLFGGKKFLHKVLPVYRLDVNFQYQQTMQILEGISHSGATTLAMLCDNNRVNQSFFRKLELVSPWCTTKNIFLLFDYIHLIKSLCNNWITEKMQELKFSDNVSIKLAKWNDLKKFRDLERESLDVAVAPKPIERQNVSICLKVFCDETVAALKSNKQLENVNDTVTFLSKFVSFFKIVNVKGRGEDSRLRDLDRGVISSVDDERLSYLLELADMVEEMKTEKQGKREKQLSKDTVGAFAHTCRGMVTHTCRGMVTKHLHIPAEVW